MYPATLQELIRKQEKHDKFKVMASQLAKVQSAPDLNQQAFIACARLSQIHGNPGSQYTFRCLVESMPQWDSAAFVAQAGHT